MKAEWDAGNLLIFGAWEKRKGVYVGESYLANPDWDVPCIEVGYFLVKEFTGKGYATEAANTAIRYAFGQLKVLRIVLRCNADNTASIRAAERCGFTQEGRSRQDHRKKDGSALVQIAAFRKAKHAIAFLILLNELIWPPKKSLLTSSAYYCWAGGSAESEGVD